jgi:hypothetical protein
MRVHLFLLGMAVAAAAAPVPANAAPSKEAMTKWGSPFRELVGPAFATGERIDTVTLDRGLCQQFRNLLNNASAHLPPSPDPDIDRLAKSGLSFLKSAADVCITGIDGQQRTYAWSLIYFRGQADLRLVQRYLGERYGVPGSPELNAPYKGRVKRISGAALEGAIEAREANLDALQETAQSAGQKRQRVLDWHPRYVAAAAPVKSALAAVLGNPPDPGAACSKLKVAAATFLAGGALPVPHPVLQTEIEAAYRNFQGIADACLAGDANLSAAKLAEAERHLGIAAQSLASYGLQP